MQLDPSKSSSLFRSLSLKRPYAKQAFALSPSRRSLDPSPISSAAPERSNPSRPTSPRPSSRSDSHNQRPSKARKLYDSQTPSESVSLSAPLRRMSHPSHPSAHSGGPSEWRSGKPSAFSGRGASRSKPPPGRHPKGKSAPKARAFPDLPGPVHDIRYIEATYMTKNLKSEHIQNPKSPVSNYLINTAGTSLIFEYAQMLAPNGQLVWRASLVIKDSDGDIIVHGDDPVKREAERLAALCAVYQLDGKGLLNKKSKPEVVQISYAPTEVTLSDGTLVDFERARQFMDYYCRRFSFGRPDITYKEVKQRGTNGFWEAVMMVGGRRIGQGSGANKKTSMTSCYVDVTQYLEKCDPELWTTFLEDAKTGKDLGVAHAFYFRSSYAVEEQVQELCDSIRKTTLYKRRPKIGSLITGSDAPETSQPASTPRYVAPFRRAFGDAAHEEKCKALKERRDAYLSDPKMEKMRNTRAALPVYTRSEDVLKHLQDNEITICMAATGSGKTTQIPQIILDDWIDRGEGSKCNIMCTQPRRLAAISVAGRVAAERGETVGRGSIGYQVRFESNLPEDHGSITFCTTGIFLKRMHSALQEGNKRSMDDVTHVIVDEVHERDVDTDLLLVVLKRLLADRRARNKPLKVVLMSATIDPTLFQRYFPDVHGQPASVVEVPGRSFPVTKSFLDDYIGQLVESCSPKTEWVFKEESVQKYLSRELGSLEVIPPSFISNRTKFPDGQDEDLELPYALIAYTISHVIRNSTDGHVLVFLPGWDEISAVQKRLFDSQRFLGLDFTDKSKFEVHVLHSSVPLLEQQRIFEPPPDGIRRVILSTNIAETSVTIPDVVYVVDTGKIKEQRYDPERHISSLVSAWVGSSNLNQRAGRAGRHRPGEYYGVLGRKRANELHPYQTVEMKRVDLTSVVMHVKALDFPGMAVEEVLAALIEPPAPERVGAAIESLKMVGALDDQKRLTSLGRVLLQLPVDPQMGKLVLFGSFFRCLDKALSLAAILTNRDPFMSPMHLKLQAAERKNSFSPEEFRSDALATLRAYDIWWSKQSNGDYVSANRFCMDNFLSKPTLLMIQKIKGHLLQCLYDSGVIDVSAGGSLSQDRRWQPRSRQQDLVVPPELDVNGDSLPLLAALISIASQPKFAIRIDERKYRTSRDKITFVHPSSVNNRKREIPAEEKASGAVHVEKHILAFAEKRQNVSVAGSSANALKFLTTTTRLDPLTYMLFGAHHMEGTQRGLLCDDWLPIVGPVDALDDIERLKVSMESCMLRVFEGIMIGRQRRGARGQPIRREEREHEDEDDDDDDEDSTKRKELPLSSEEVKELDWMTEDLVRILNEYSMFRVRNQSRPNSRPVTPSGSPTLVGGRLPSISGMSSYGGSRSGYSTPYHSGAGSVFGSRPSTPSRLSKNLVPSNWDS